jgi:solute:Na+ symporter, SSS family
MNDLESFFSLRDWGFVGACLGVTVAITCLFRRVPESENPETKPLPWPVVGASLILSELTGWIFLAVPGVMLAIHGDLAYVQWLLVSLMVRIVVGVLVMRRGWLSGREESALQKREGFVRPLRGLLAFVSHFGSWLGLALRMLVLVLPLTLLTSWSLEWCLLVIVAGAALMVAMGGIRAVAKVESIQLLCLVGASVFVFVSLACSLTDGWAGSLERLRQSENFEGVVRDKLAILDFRIDPVLNFTFWTALLCYPLHQWQVLTLDRGTLLRLHLCADARAAGRAVLSGSLGLIVTLLLLGTGLALFLSYRASPPEDPMILRVLAWTGGEPTRYDLALPIWILTELPEGTRGWIFGAFFAASLTGLQASLLSLPRLPRPTSLTKVMSAFLWGLAAAVLSIGLIHYQRASGIGLLSLGYGLAAFTVGPILGLSLLAARGKSGVRPVGAMVGVIVSFALVLLNRFEVWQLIFGDFVSEWLERQPESLLIVERSPSISSFLSSVWLWPITALLTWVCGWRKRP